MKFKKYISLLSAMTPVVFSINMLVTMPNAVAEKNSCISYNMKENEISISCKYANFIDIEDELQNQNILYRESNPSNFNEKYGIDPHTGTHNMLILNNIVYDNYNAGIICSADCYNILIEGNKVYNNGHGDNMRGIAVSKKVSNTII